MTTLSTALALPSREVEHSEYGSFQSLLDHITLGVIVWSSDLVCELVNKPYYQLVGLTENELYPGVSIEQLYETLILQKQVTREQANKVLEISYGSRAVEFERTKSDGTVLSFVSRPLDTGGMVVTLTDVTEAKQHERKLDEIAAQAEQAESRMSAALAAGKKQRDDANTLSEFGDWLHSCETLNEVLNVVRQALEKAFKNTSGELYIYNNSRDGLDLGTSWGAGQATGRIRQRECWALRRGRINAFGEALVNLPCEHVSTSDSPSDSTHYLCVPIIAHGDTVGMLHIDLSAYAKDKPTEKLFSTDLLRIITRYAEHISLAVANVKLRQQLREQSTRDSLTGMYNRRHFTELAKDALAEAEESHQTAAIAVFDIDNFKTFNDQFGHDAGDRVLIELAKVARDYFDEGVLFSRMGGEEFSILMSGVDLCTVKQRIAEFANTLAQTTILHGNSSLPPCTISVGVSMYPENGDSLHDLIRAADSAMYKAKSLGKNCICGVGDDQTRPTFPQGNTSGTNHT
jgi:diguanylate cyclase (GGDEF)-like protein